jgi:6-pyruvoyl-tetrahydropterin synthase
VVHARAEFDATHALVRYQGRAEQPHSHRWRVAVRVGTDVLGEEGYALDFHRVQEILEGVVQPLAGTDLGRHPEIGRPSPSAERVAEVVAGRLAPRYAGIGGRLLTVSVWEGPDNRVDLVLDA